MFSQFIYHFLYWGFLAIALLFGAAIAIGMVFALWQWAWGALMHSLGRRYNWEKGGLLDGQYGESGE